MSSILKALKKLEQEKAERRETTIDLSRDILRDGPRGRRPFPWAWGSAAGLIVLLLALIAVLLGRGTPPPRNGVSTTTPATSSVQALTPVMPSAAPAPANGSQPPSRPGRQEGAPTRPAAIVAPPAPRQPALAPAPASQQASQPSLPATAEVPARFETARKPPAAADGADHQFTVSGIAWKRDSADRLAIVNGQPLTTGSYIAGAIIEEIFPDKVRFFQSGKTFDIPLGPAGKDR
jgi:general secretion pathway protein B